MGKGKKLPRGLAAPRRRSGSISRVLSTRLTARCAGIHLGRRLPDRLCAAYPGMITRRTTSLPLFGLAPDEVFPATYVTAGAVSSYLTISPLPGKPGGIFSVALSVGSPPLGVTQHPVLRSSDFPHRRSEDRQARPPDPLPQSDCSSQAMIVPQLSQ